MQIAEYIPTELLKPYIKEYKIIESHYGTTNRVLPSTSFTMSFCFKGQIAYLNDTNKTTLRFATFSGVQKSARLINYDTDTSAIIIIFKEMGLSAFFRQPLHELFGHSVSLDNYFSRSELSMVEEQLESNQDNGKRIEIIEQLLLTKLTAYNTDALIADAITRINAANGNVRIRALAKELYISQDAFEKRFRKITGTTPKQFSYIIKMNTVIRKFKTVPSFLDMAFENGYHDQPHFNKDFKIFTGQTPTDFLRSALYW